MNFTSIIIPAAHHPKTMQELHPIRVLIHELKSRHDSRISTYQALPTFIIALGPERAVRLLPLLIKALLQQETEECQIIILEQMPKLLVCLGGAKNAHVLLKLLFQVWGIKETSMWRECVYDCLRRVLLHVDIKKSQDVISNLVKKLYHFERYQLALRLISQTFIAMSEHGQHQLLVLLQQVMQIPGAQLSASRQLGELSKITPPAPEQILLRLYNWCMASPNESTRTALIQVLPNYSYIGGESAQAIKYLNGLIECKSLAVEVMVNRSCQLAQAFGQSTVKGMLQNLMREFGALPTNLKMIILTEYQMVHRVLDEEAGSAYLQIVKECLYKETGLALKQACLYSLNFFMGEGNSAFLEEFKKALIALDNQYRLKLLQKITKVNNSILTELFTVLAGSSIQSLGSWRNKVTVLTTLKALALKNQCSFSQSTLHACRQFFDKMLAEKIHAVREQAVNLAAVVFKDCDIKMIATVLFQLDKKKWQIRQHTVMLVKQAIRDKEKQRILLQWAEKDPAPGVREAANMM